jgi:uncharacterized protein YfiM (DUF2279 family)
MIRPDLIKHFLICFIVTAIAGSHGAAASMAAGVTKEWCDSKQPGNKWDWWDIAADVAGAACGLAFNYLLNYFTHHPLH